MQIYSWNMLYLNKRLDRAFEAISGTDFDIFCLQEVPQRFLERLAALPCHMEYGIDGERGGAGKEPIYLVVLSRHPIVAAGRIPFPDYWPSVPLRGRLFIYLMRFFHFTRVHNRGGLYVDIQIGEDLVRVFNLHLVLFHANVRLREFEIAMTERDRSRPTIVCGDFNILEKPHIVFLNWLLGSPLRETFPHDRERTHIEARFIEHEFTNALAGKMTHPLSRSQLDHILLSPSFTLKEAEVIRDRAGSDHHPIRVRVA